MVIVKIKGGFGNQLFTYASAYAISQELQQNLIMDKVIYDLDYFRKFELPSLSLKYDQMLISKFVPNTKVKTLIYKVLRRLKLKGFTEVHEKKEFSFDENIYNLSGDIYLDGYWQNYRYFHKYYKDLSEMFVPRETPRKEVTDYITSLRGVNSVAMHVRRGDYKTFNGGKCLSLDYYIKAMEYFNSNDVQFYVFTDDIDFCEKNLPNSENINYVSRSEKLTDIEEFFIMKECKNFIIANSSFSWWAAYLSEQKADSLIVAPVVDMWKRDFYPDEWVALNTHLE